MFVQGSFLESGISVDGPTLFLDSKLDLQEVKSKYFASVVQETAKVIICTIHASLLVGAN